MTSFLGKKLLQTLLSVLLLTSLAAPVNAAERISGYKAIFRPCRDSAGHLAVAIRQFLLGSDSHLLLVNPTTLETALVPAAATSPASAEDAESVARSPFVAALARLTANPKLQNAGLVHAESPQPGVFLTVDMCPSKKPFEKEMFVAVGNLSGKEGAVPLAVAMTGKWLERHPDELNWLKEQVAAGHLAITWVNHSYSHPYEPAKPYRFNFLLSIGVNLEEEVLSTERALLEKGLIPSPFFRFPGLVADRGLLDKLRQLSLIPVGSDAWLAKGETPVNGSIILVHGNGNEPQGIARLLPLLRGDHPPKLLPLQKAVAVDAH